MKEIGNARFRYQTKLKHPLQYKKDKVKLRPTHNEKQKITYAVFEVQAYANGFKQQLQQKTRKIIEVQ